MYPKEDALGSALRLLGQQMKVEDRPFLRQRTTSPVPEVASGASDGRISSLGLAGLEDRIEKKEQTGNEPLSKEQKLYVAVEDCDAEINKWGACPVFL